MTARSVVASTLLGVEPPRLTTRILVRSGELFGIAEGTTRVALSRMVAAGELRPDEDGYRLAGRLLDRQARQTASRRAETEAWDGTWELAIVRTGGARRAADRVSLRHALADLRLAELREGSGCGPPTCRPTGRPTPGPSPPASASRAATSPRPAARPAALWDLAGWADDARALQAELTELQPRFEAARHGGAGGGVRRLGRRPAPAATRPVAAEGPAPASVAGRRPASRLRPLRRRLPGRVDRLVPPPTPDARSPAGAARQ